MKKLLNRKGYSTIELLVVVVIIGLLVAIGSPIYAGARQSAKETAFDATRRQLHQVAEMHLLSGGGDAIWAPFAGQKAGETISGAHESWFGLLEKWPENPLQTGEFMVEIKGGKITVSPGRE